LHFLLIVTPQKFFKLIIFFFCSGRFDIVSIIFLFSIFFESSVFLMAFLFISSS